MQERLAETEQLLSDETKRKVEYSTELAQKVTEIADYRDSQAKLVTRVNKLVDRFADKEKELEGFKASQGLLAEENAELKKRLEESEEMDKEKGEKLQELQRENQSLASKTDELRTNWIEQEKALNKVEDDRDNLQSKVNELQRTILVMKEDLKAADKNKDWDAENKKLKKRLLESEKILVMVANEKTELMKQKKALEKQMKPAKPANPTKHERQMSDELTKMQMVLLKEKKEMIDRQLGLEKMLMEALEGGKSFDLGGENVKVNTKKKAGRHSLDKRSKPPMIQTDRAASVPSTPRKPLSPTTFSKLMSPKTLNSIATAAAVDNKAKLLTGTYARRAASASPSSRVPVDPPPSPSQRF